MSASWSAPASPWRWAPSAASGLGSGLASFNRSGCSTPTSGGVGLSNEQALAAITAMPARIFGLADRGTLAPGQRGDVVVWDGDPLELTSAPVAVLIAGVPQPLDNRQTALRDRYRDLGRQDLPLAYPR